MTYKELLESMLNYLMDIANYTDGIDQVTQNAADIVGNGAIGVSDVPA